MFVEISVSVSFGESEEIFVESEKSLVFFVDIILSFLFEKFILRCVFFIKVFRFVLVFRIILRFENEIF